MNPRMERTEMQEARPLSAVTRAGNVMTYPILKTAHTAEEIAENDTQTAVKKQHTKGVNIL